MNIKILICFLFIALIVSTRLEAVTATIGNVSDGCTYATIQQALNDPTVDIIRLLKDKEYTEYITIDRPITIEGGWSSCSGFVIFQSGQSIIQGGSYSGPIITVHQSISPSANVNLKNLNLTQGSKALSIHGGNVIVEQVDIHHNQTIDDGGGIFVNNNSFLSIYASTINNNAADNGGGIYCSQANIFIRDTLISANQASLVGGGLYSTKCNIGMVAINDFYLTGFTDNQANSYGGGVYNKSGAAFNAHGKVNNRVVFDNNKGTHGAAIKNSGAIFLNSVEMKNHTVGETLITSTSDNPDSFIYMYCDSLSSICNSIHDNNLIILFAINVGANSENGMNVFKIEHTEVYNNTAHNVIGTSGYPHNNYRVKILNSLIVDNIVDNVITSQNSNSVLFDLAHVTIANNNLSQSALFYSTDPAHYSVSNSILVADDASLISLNNNGAFATANCTVSTGINGITQSGNGNIIADPLFADSAKGDYRITSQSPAVDICALSDLSVIISDIDGEARGWDYDSAANNVGMIYDAGADELGDSIFVHDFE